MAMEPLDFEHDGADIFRPRRRLDACGLLHGLRIGDRVDASANAANALREHGDFVIGHDRIRELFDSAVDHESPVFAAPHDFPFHEKPEMLRLVKRRVKRSEGDHGRSRRRLVEGIGVRVVIINRRNVKGDVFS